ncbi:serine hydrolase [Patescibacteria group bacterium]|nr:serine hydrolase [Patescibacteria group bacterium]MBU1034634.1 serine hydrolase [Patescibacteria group bacterium]MBU1629492.1 serine hydrolase [Patescibacteria group bacterium]MBU1908250.1 serine hydrolase [Patescibacteria group bacterium]
MNFSKILCVTMAVCVLMPLPVFGAESEPQTVKNVTPYAVGKNEFAAALVMDADSGKILYEYQPDKIWPMASLTKLMTALIFMVRRPAWTEVVAMSDEDEVGGGRLRVSTGAKLTVQDLLYSAITASANNAAMALARISGLVIDKFVAAMNTQAKAMGLRYTKFYEPSGMNPENVSTAREIAKLASFAFSVRSIRRVASTASYSFEIQNTGEIKKLTNTNDLLIAKENDDVYVTGGKTGFLYESMYNLAVRMKPASDADNDRLLIVVVLGSPTRDASFASAKAIANWAWDAYGWH